MNALTLEFELPKPPGRAAASNAAARPDRLPRITKLMALAIKLDGLVRQGVFGDFAEIAQLGHVSRPRLTQIMNLLNLAPDIQEQLLLLSTTRANRDPISEVNLRKLTQELRWDTQREMWIAISRRRKIR